jgi:hypothetical protein
MGHANYEISKHLWENRESMDKYLAKLKKLMEKDEQPPRRIRMDLWSPAEKAIGNAVQEVEKMAADVRLTNAVILLLKARDLVADFIDNIESPSPEVGEEKKEIMKHTKSGIELIANERRRQIEKEGWTPEHDDAHDEHELYDAAKCYAKPESIRPYRYDYKGIQRNLVPFGEDPDSYTSLKGWPWKMEWWKPSPENRVKELIKAGALYQAEIDRIERLKLKIATEIDKLQNSNL